MTVEKLNAENWLGDSIQNDCDKQLTKAQPLDDCRQNDWRHDCWQSNNRQNACVTAYIVNNTTGQINTQPNEAVLLIELAASFVKKRTIFFHY